MTSRRKQRLSVKSDEMVDHLAERHQTADDPFLLDEGNSSWLVEAGDTSGALDITPTFTALDNELLNLLDFPLDLDTAPADLLSQENREIFQDLQITSTPKSRPSCSSFYSDSGFEQSYKKFKPDTSNNTLHDITDKFDSSCNSFINITQLSESGQIENVNKRHVSILRKDIITKPPKHDISDSPPISKDQLTYYTGIKNYDMALAILKHIKMPKGKYSKFKMEFITLMKLRLNLQWRDMSYRFSISERELKDMTSIVLDIMSYSLEEFLPWHTQRKVTRRANKCIYGHTIFSEASGLQVLVLLLNNKRPVLYVSAAHPLSKAPIYLLNDCANNLITGDIVCLADVQGKLTCYKMEQTTTGLSVICLSDTSFSSGNFVEVCQKFVIDLLSEFSLILRPEPGMDLVKLVKIAGALTNANSLDEISNVLLGKLYQRSAQLIGNML